MAPFRLRKMKGKEDEIRTGLVEHWRETKIPEFQEEAEEARSNYEAVRSRYQAALDRLRRARGLPNEAALDKIQRYEGHLERGLHKALERLLTLQEARGACVPSSHKPAVAIAVIQNGQGTGEMGSFGSFASGTDGGG
jgi:hypothetical protein